MSAPIVRVLVVVASAFLLGLLCGPQRTWGQSLSEDVVATITERAQAHGRAPGPMIELARCESKFDPFAIGRLDERGLYQLHPQGLLPTFRAWGYTDWTSAYQQADFVARALNAGMADHWRATWGRRCA